MGTAGASYGVSRSLRSDRDPCVLDAAATRAGGVVRVNHCQVVPHPNMPPLHTRTAGRSALRVRASCLIRREVPRHFRLHAIAAYVSG
jgi:hypothetical protein